MVRKHQMWEGVPPSSRDFGHRLGNYVSRWKPSRRRPPYLRAFRTDTAVPALNPEYQPLGRRLNVFHISISALVTSNLDRGYGTRIVKLVRTISDRNAAIHGRSSLLPSISYVGGFGPARRGSSRAKSLQLNILPPNYLISIFCRSRNRTPQFNRHGMNNLHKSTKNIGKCDFEAKSLFWNILDVNYLFSGFCAAITARTFRKHNKTHTLPNLAKKLREAHAPSAAMPSSEFLHPYGFVCTPVPFRLRDRSPSQAPVQPDKIRRSVDLSCL